MKLPTPPVDADPLPGSEPADSHWMKRALELARRGIGVASPNPTVGCVLVKPEPNGLGHAVGEGFHAYDVIDHAEVAAIKQAGEAARGATAYVTLEPCSHQGRTGPCVKALLEAGIRRVVIATIDPNPKVRGQGIEQLREAGVEVLVGVCEHEAQRINDAFACYVSKQRPFVTLKVGISLDGNIAPPPGDHPPGSPFWISGQQSLARVQELRHASDAVLTGIGTVLADDPLLNDRSGLPRRRPLLRVILDSSLRLRLSSQVVRTVKEDVMVFCSAVVGDRFRSLEALGIRIERMASAQEGKGVPLDKVLEHLAGIGIMSVMLEAGPHINGSAIAGDLVDKIIMFYAPMFLGNHAVPLLRTPDFDWQRSGNRLKHVSMEAFGEDICLSGYLHDPWDFES